MPDYDAMEGHTDRMHDSFPRPTYADGSNALNMKTTLSRDSYGNLPTSDELDENKDQSSYFDRYLKPGKWKGPEVANTSTHTKGVQ